MELVVFDLDGTLLSRDSVISEPGDAIVTHVNVLEDS